MRSLIIENYEVCNTCGGLYLRWFLTEYRNKNDILCFKCKLCEHLEGGKHL